MPLAKKQFVQIFTGEVEESAFVEERTPSHLQGQKQTLFWFAWDLTRKQEPDSRKRAQRVGVEKSTYGLSGKWAFYDPETELKAAPVRGKIADLEARLEQARNELLEIYASDAKNLLLTQY